MGWRFSVEEVEVGWEGTSGGDDAAGTEDIVPGVVLAWLTKGRIGRDLDSRRGRYADGEPGG